MTKSRQCIQILFKMMFDLTEIKEDNRYNYREYIEDFKNRTQSILDEYFPELGVHMGLFKSEPKIYRNFDKRIFIGSSVSNAKTITNIGLVKVSVPVQGQAYSFEDEALKDELLKVCIDNGNAIINFRIERGTNTGRWLRMVLVLLLHMEYAVFIEYND
ncbi:relaxosome protein TraM [Providencia hangzhouensis]|uniref:relaxosome protein TraM n=1 Tax=Providencia hangzhouensis TaxID=3031799 RepID=UPI00397A4C3D